MQNFVKTTRILESLMLLRSRKAAKNAINKFILVDPDSVPDVPTSSSQIIYEKIEKREQAFLKEFSKLLQKAGYKEIPESSVKSRLTNRHRYGRIEVKLM